MCQNGANWQRNIPAKCEKMLNNLLLPRNGLYVGTLAPSVLEPRVKVQANAQILCFVCNLLLHHTLHTLHVHQKWKNKKNKTFVGVGMREYLGEFQLFFSDARIVLKVRGRH